jgi:thiamine-phosphate pyrophosphorylase
MRRKSKGPIDVSLYAIVDPQIARGRSLGKLAREAADNGATIVQLRAKDVSTREFMAHARDVKAALTGSDVVFLINDRVDIALAVGADGAHIGRDDMPVPDAVRTLGSGAIIGVTIKSAAELALTGPYGDDWRRIAYAAIGGVFQTVHKDNPDKPVGLDGLARIRAEARRLHDDLPICAIAGIDVSNAASVIHAGADGVAVIGALFGGDDVAARTMRLRTVVNTAKAERRAKG